MAIGEVNIDELGNSITVDDATQIPSLKTTIEGGIRKFKNISALVWKNYFQDFTNGLRLTSERIAMQEKTSGTLTTSGWYTIAETGTASAEVFNSQFEIVGFGSGRTGTFGFKTKLTGSPNAKTNVNTQVEITGRSSFNTDGGGNSISGARIAKSDSVNGSGFKAQVYLDVALNITFTTQLTNNVSKPGLTGFQLVEPYLDDTPTLPDGVTAATFIEAGAELSFANNSVYFSGVTGRKSTSDVLFVEIDMGQLPKQGTGVTFSNPTNIVFNDAAGGSAQLVNPTYSNFAVRGKKITFNINDTGVFAALSANSRCSMRSISITVNLTITG